MVQRGVDAELRRELLGDGGVSRVGVAVVTVEIGPGVGVFERIVELARQLTVRLRAPGPIGHAIIAAARRRFQPQIEQLP